MKIIQYRIFKTEVNINRLEQDVLHDMITL